MLTTPMDVLTQFPVRKNRKQKQSFRDAVQAYAAELGYACKIEKGSYGSRNIIIGDPEKAKYLVTAHYDTPARMFLPNFITPRNILIYLLYQFLVVGLMIAVSIGGGIGLGVLLESPETGKSLAAVFYWVLLILMMAGPANRHNANDNTSGVVTLLEIARTLPALHREQVCFVLFDLEEAGMLGSASYRKSHKKETDNQIVLNMDCVGDGDEIVFFPTRKLKKDTAAMNRMRRCGGYFGQKHISVQDKGFAFYPSDQMQFPLGVGIAAFRKKKGLGLYLSRIHTSKDTVLEETNINILRACISTLTVTQ